MASRLSPSSCPDIASRLSLSSSKLSSYDSLHDGFKAQAVIDSGLGGVPQEQKMLKGHLPRVI